MGSKGARAPALAQAQGGQIWAALPIAPPRTLLAGPGRSAIADHGFFVAAPASATFDLHESANRRTHAAEAEAVPGEPPLPWARRYQL
jgi:hypothetical protein